MAVGKIIALSFLLTTGASAFGQLHYSISADFTEETTNGDSINNVSKGHITYDNRNNTLTSVYSYPFDYTVELTFNKITQWHHNQKEAEIKADSSLLKSSLLYKAINGTLYNGGAEDYNYRITNVSKRNGAVFTEYSLPENYIDTAALLVSKIIISQANNRLNAVVMLNKQGSPMVRTFYYNYINVDGIDFPTQIVSVTYQNGEIYSKTTYNNVVVDNITTQIQGTTHITSVTQKCEEYSETSFNPLFAFYRRIISPQDIQKCSFYPSCSHYSQMTFSHNGFFYGFADTFDRLLRCSGISKPGYLQGNNGLLIDYPLKRKE